MGIVAYALGLPVKDDAQWLKHIVLTQGDSLEDIRVSYAPVIKNGGKPHERRQSS